MAALKKDSLTLGGVSLGEIPRVIAIVERILSDAELTSLLLKKVRLLELRADAFAHIAFPELLSFAGTARKKGLGLLGTLRFTPQARERKKGDKFQESPRRLERFAELLPYVDAIDVEYESQQREALTALARQQQCLVLLSTHDFSATPDTDQMEGVLREARRLGADIVKLAYYTRSAADLRRLTDFVIHCGFPHLVWIAMGSWGQISRIMACFFGSLFSYAFIDRANAPGQFSVDQLHNALLHYHPRYQEYINANSIENRA